MSRQEKEMREGARRKRQEEPTVDECDTTLSLPPSGAARKTSGQNRDGVGSPAGEAVGSLVVGCSLLSPLLLCRHWYLVSGP